MDLEVITFYFTNYGAVAIFVIVLLEYLNLPGFPAGVIMPLSGVMAANGGMNFFLVMVITVAAGLTGSLILYFLGRIGGNAFFKAYTKHFPKQRETLEKNLSWVDQKGCIGVFFAKLIPMLRTLVSIPAGVVRMNLTQYIVSSTLGIIIWNLLFVGAGYLLGERVFALFV